LINSPVHKNWDIILIQEPYIDSYGNAKATTKWRTVYPSSRFTNGATVRSVILINANLDTNHWNQLTLPGTNDITALQFQGPYGRLSIFNIYNDCLHSESLTLLDNYLASNKQLIYRDAGNHMLWCGDFNRHHPLWDEERNGHLFTAKALEDARQLVGLVADYDMVMPLPQGIPTLQSMVTGNWTRPDNVFCSAATSDHIISCDTSPRQRGPGTDHVPIQTVIDIPMERKELPLSYNFRMVDWEVFNEELLARIGDIPEPVSILTEDQLSTAIDNLTSVLQDVIRTTVPLNKPCPHTKRWWNEDLNKLKKKKNKLSNLSSKFRAVLDHPSHEELRLTRNKYGEAITKAKEAHWIDFLEEASERELWIANKYISNPVNNGGKTRIPALKVTNSSGQIVSVETNEGKSEVLANSFFPKKPDSSSVPDDCVYPPPLPSPPMITEEQIRRHIAKLSPHKAFGPDEIPNIVLMRSVNVIIKYLLRIYRAILTLGAYSDRWRAFTTVVLWKPGKASYDVPKAYRPIALLNTMAKVLTAIVAEGITYLAESHQLLPSTHFGGRPGRMTTDAVHVLIYRIRSALRRKRVASVLFLDIEGAFPNAVTDRVLHNMRKRRMPEHYVTFVNSVLCNRETRLKFDDYLSGPIQIDNGIGQGDPMSMIIYLFYNADFLDIPDNKDEACLAFVDDTFAYAEGHDFSDTCRKIRRLMNKPGGGFDWLAEHNSRFEMSKLAVMHFSKKRTSTGSGPGKTVSISRPDLVLRGNVVKQVQSYKYLGIWIDQELRWGEQAKQTIAKSTAWTMLFRCLSRQNKGISPKLMQRLYKSVAIPKMTYGIDVWWTPVHKPPDKKRKVGSVGVTKELGKIQRMASLAITGALRSTATDVLDLHANLLPIELLLHRICYRAVTRIACLPDTHPLYNIARNCSDRLVKKHRSPLHNLIWFYNAHPYQYETIKPAIQPPIAHKLFSTHIAESRDSSMEDSAMDNSNIKIFSDGSGIDGQAGAAAVLFRQGRQSPKVLRYHLGPLTDYTTYSAEAVGASLALHLLTEENEVSTVSLNIDCQATITALAKRDVKSGQSIIEECIRLARKCYRNNRQSGYRLVVRWISGHSGIEGNEVVDREAKRAAQDGSSDSKLLPRYLRSGLPYNLAACRQDYDKALQRRWETAWHKSPRHRRLAKIDASFPLKSFFKISATLSRSQYSLIVQIRTGHFPLMKYLHRINRADTPNCPNCVHPPAEETVHHYLFECPAYINERWAMTLKLGRNAKSMEYIMNNKDALHELLKYMGKTKRLKELFGDVIRRPI